MVCPILLTPPRRSYSSQAIGCFSLIRQWRNVADSSSLSSAGSWHVKRPRDAKRTLLTFHHERTVFSCVKSGLVFLCCFRPCTMPLPPTKTCMQCCQHQFTLARPRWHTHTRATSLQRGEGALLKGAACKNRDSSPKASPTKVSRIFTRRGTKETPDPPFPPSSPGLSTGVCFSCGLFLADYLGGEASHPLQLSFLDPFRVFVVVSEFCPPKVCPTHQPGDL